jgi:hypothetical protein
MQAQALCRRFAQKRRKEHPNLRRRYPSCIVDGGLTVIADNADIRVLQR